MKEKLEMRTFLWFLLAISVVFLLMLQSLFGPIFWACAIAIIFHPLHQFFLRRWPNRQNTSALLTLFICFLVVIVPVIFVVAEVVSEGIDLYNSLHSGTLNPVTYIDEFNKAFPHAKRRLAKFGIDLGAVKENALDALMSTGKMLAEHAFSWGQNAAGVLLDFGLMLYLTFFMLRDGNQLIELMVRALPLGDRRERQLFALFGEVTRATVKGNLVVALVQGVLGGIIFSLLDVPGALLWGALMTFTSLLPAVGSALVWAPIAIFLFVTDQHRDAFILIAFCAGVIGSIDNVLRPILVGRDTKLPDYMVLLSTLGGITLFGINGFVVGPLVAAVFVAFWGIFMTEVHVRDPDQPDAV